MTKERWHYLKTIHLHSYRIVWYLGNKWPKTIIWRDCILKILGLQQWPVFSFFFENQPRIKLDESGPLSAFLFHPRTRVILLFYRVGQTQLGSFWLLITNQSNNTRDNGKVPFVVDRLQHYTVCCERGQYSAYLVRIEETSWPVDGCLSSSV
jgi:hypothetical protein